MKLAMVITLACASLLLGSSCMAAGLAPLVLETKIPLGSVRGRIDHLAIDRKRDRLFVAELGNNSLGVVDLKAGKVQQTIHGLREPQGVAYIASTDAVYVADAGDGTVHIFDGVSLAHKGEIALGADADNIHLSPNARQLVVGFGNGALAVIDPATAGKTRTIRLKGHPEGFQFDRAGHRLFVNVPGAHLIAVVDLDKGEQAATWKIHADGANFPLNVDPDSQRVIAAFRAPSALEVLNANDGTLVARIDTCVDADDVFVDSKRRRLYVSCGEGFVDVIGYDGTGYSQIAHVRTAPGARTSLFVPELDQLFVAVPERSAQSAAVWIYRVKG